MDGDKWLASFPRRLTAEGESIVVMNMEALKMGEAGFSETLVFIKLRHVNIPKGCDPNT
jgi:hypothetical protein